MSSKLWNPLVAVLALTLTFLCTPNRLKMYVLMWAVRLIIPLYFEEKDLLKYVREFCKLCVFPPLTFILKMPEVMWAELKQGWWMPSFSISCLHLESHNSSQELKWKACYQYDRKQAPSGFSSGVISKGNRVLWHVSEKALRKVQTSLGPVQGGMEQPEEKQQPSAPPWHAPSSGNSWQDSHQIRHSFQTLLYLFFNLSFQKKNNTAFRQEAEFSILVDPVRSKQWGTAW